MNARGFREAIGEFLHEAPLGVQDEHELEPIPNRFVEVAQPLNVWSFRFDVTVTWRAATMALSALVLIIAAIFA